VRRSWREKAGFSSRFEALQLIVVADNLAIKAWRPKWHRPRSLSEYAR
jgi:hypothetical protein